MGAFDFKNTEENLFNICECIQMKLYRTDKMPRAARNV